MLAPVKFHMSLNVNDLAKAIAFYRVLFDREPAKRYSDYAKFELDEPALVLSLEPQSHGRGGSLNHLGFRVNNAASLIAVQRRLEEAGISTTREEGVACCYAKQTKFWVSDPDGNNWEMYVLEEDTETRGSGSAPSEPVSDSSEREPIKWEHWLGGP